MLREKPKVLIIENSIDVTGALKSITRTAYDLSKEFDFIFVLPQNSKGRFWIEGKGFMKIYELPMHEISKRLGSLILYVPYLLVNTFRLNKIIKQNNISLVHLNDLYNLIPVVLRLFNKNLVYVCHIRFLPEKFPGWLFNFWLRLHFKYAKKIIVVSNSVLKQLPEHSKLTLIYNELPLVEQHPEVLDNTDKTTFSFLYLSNFMQGKGQNYALEAFARIHHKLPQWKLRFVGGDMGLKKNKDFRKSLQERAKRFGFFDKIEWVPFTEDVEREYKQADIVLNFSESESFSITCLEALYFGRPLIATDCGGPSEIIDPGKTGLLIENRNVSKMAEAMLHLATDNFLKDELSVNSRNLVRVKFSAENTSHKIREVYSDILEQL